MQICSLLSVTVNNNTVVDMSALMPRLCHLKKWPDFNGYGLALRDHRGKHYIDKVHRGSPAEAGGLKEFDRIVEVDGKNKERSSHSKVVQCIREARHETKLLVVDKRTDEFFKEKGVCVKGNMPDVQKIECPAKRPNSLGMLSFSLYLNCVKHYRECCAF